MQRLYEDHDVINAAGHRDGWSVSLEAAVCMLKLELHTEYEFSKTQA
jgi:hypothetical protein